MLRHLRVFLTYPDILVMSLLALTVLALGLTRAGDLHTWEAMALGSLLFFLDEYVTHRFVFHMAPPKHPALRRSLERLHYAHHERPEDLHLLFLPLWFTLPLLALFGLLAWLLTGQPLLGAAFVAGSSLSLLYYEWTHFVAHRPVTPLTPWGRWMKKYHLWHHYKNEHYWFGVTNPSLDLLFGTYRDQAEVPKSATARRLAGE